MKSFLRKYPQLSLLSFAIMAAAALFALGAPQALGLTLVAGTQLALLALCPQAGACFSVAALTPEQVKEFGDICNSLKGIPEEFKLLKEDTKKIKAQELAIAELQKTLNEVRRQQLKDGRGSRGGLRYLGNGQAEVSDDCARHIGAMMLVAGIKQDRFSGRQLDFAEGLCREVLGLNGNVKSALTSSDIPLPTEFNGQVVELVGLYGMARKYGTVFPLGSGTVKLPKLNSDPTFTLNAVSAAVDEKSPGAAFVTFSPEKFGGLVRLPSEIDEDSVIPMGQFIARYGARNMARAEDYNFFASTGAGSGVNGSVAGLTASTITNSKVTQMASGKTKYSDMTLANLRTLRTVPDSTAIRTGAYYFHPTFEQALAALNTSGDRPYNPNAQLANPGGAQPFINGPTLDGFPVRWVDVLPAYSTSNNAAKVFALFGDLSFQYLGIRGGMRFDTSRDAGFTTDEILIRILERFTIGLMATGAVAGLETAAS